MTIQLGFNIADIIALVVVLIGLYFGYKRGLSGQMALVLTGLAVCASLVNGLAPCREWLTTRFAMPADLARMAAILILVIIPVSTIMLLYSLLRFVLKITFTTWIDRLGGALAGALTAAGVVVLVFMLVNVLPDSQRPAKMGPESWVTRNVIGAEADLIKNITHRVQTGETILEQAREKQTSRREKWEN